MNTCRPKWTKALSFLSAFIAILSNLWPCHLDTSLSSCQGWLAGMKTPQPLLGILCNILPIDRPESDVWGSEEQTWLMAIIVSRSHSLSSHPFWWQIFLRIFTYLFLFSWVCITGYWSQIWVWPVCWKGFEFHLLWIRKHEFLCLMVHQSLMIFVNLCT